MNAARAALASVSLLFATNAHASVEDFQSWMTLNLGGDLSKSVVANLELQGRLTDDVSRLGVAIVRPTIGYRVNKALTVHVGYAHQTSINDGRPDLDENRYFLQSNWRIGKIGAVTVNSRARLELRTVRGRNDSGWRVRNRMQLSIPTKAKGINILVSNELLFDLDATSWGQISGFDQTRNFIGVEVPLSKAVRLETGFQHRYQRRLRAQDRSDFIVPIALSIRL